MAERSALSQLLLRLTYAGPDGQRRLSFNDAPGAAAYVNPRLFDACLDEIDTLDRLGAEPGPLQALGMQLLMSTAGLSNPEALSASLRALAEEAVEAKRRGGCH